MTLRLIPAGEAYAYQQPITDMIEEWQQTGEKIVPYAMMCTISLPIASRWSSTAPRMTRCRIPPSSVWRRKVARS